MLSGVGGALARRRLETSWFSLLLGPLVFGFLLFSLFSVNLPKNPNLSSSVFFFSDRHLWNAEREQCFITFLNQTSSINLSLNRATEFLHQSNDDAAGQIWRLYRSGKQTKPDLASSDDAVAQIWGLYRSGKQTKPDPALRPSSRYKSTKNHSKQCDRPLPPPSTLTPAFPSPARRFMSSTMTPANPPCLTLPSTRTPASTPHFILPSTIIPASTPHHVLPSTMTPASTQHLLRRAVISPPSLASRHASTISSSTKAKLGFPLEGLAFKTGPSTSSRPKPIICAPIINETKPSFGLVSNMAVSLEENWKKTPVDNKKIFAQPHQSFKSLSFSFFPRSEISFADDLAKKAVRSMTTYLYMFL